MKTRLPLSREDYEDFLSRYYELHDLEPYKTTDAIEEMAAILNILNLPPKKALLLGKLCWEEQREQTVA
ncbi:MAG: hypothetical protein KGI79_03420 [Patescibacteria group bacterium]|nr:hypothetical protein [Patescibacteria group bacterium]